MVNGNTQNANHKVINYEVIVECHKRLRTDLSAAEWKNFIEGNKALSPLKLNLAKSSLSIKKCCNTGQ